MAISSVTLPWPVGTSKSQTGTFTTDASGTFTMALTAGVGANATKLIVASTAGFLGGELITLPGGGFNGDNQIITILGASLLAGGELTIHQPAVVTGVPSGTVISRWDRIAVAGQPKRVKLTSANGDTAEWIAGMEPGGANVITSGGAPVLQLKYMYVQAGAVHFAPGILAISTTYTILVEF